MLLALRLASILEVVCGVSEVHCRPSALPTCFSRLSLALFLKHVLHLDQSIAPIFKLSIYWSMAARFLVQQQLLWCSWTCVQQQV